MKQQNGQYDGGSLTTQPIHTDTPATKVSTKDSPARDKSASTAPKSTTSALAAAGMGKQVRDSSPSLAREIASRRGIPQKASPGSSAKMLQLPADSPRSTRSGLTSRIPPAIVDSQATLTKAKQTKKAADDDGFSKFYNDLTTGTMSKLSSVLAYAGLPLTADDIRSDQKSSQSSKSTVTAGNEPDMRKIFSKAALNAIEEQQRQHGNFGHGFGPAESFYVVPPTGMTTSFADIARRRGSHGQDDDDFAEAREWQGPASPKSSRAGQAQLGATGRNTAEELELQNATLKQTLEQLAVRLAEFENHAQDASMVALNQSMMLQGPSAGAPDVVMLERLRRLEGEVEKAAEDKRKLQARAEKQERTIQKYESKYKGLIDGARARQKAKEAPSDGKVDASGASRTPAIG